MPHEPTPDRHVPWGIGIPPEVKTEYAGVTLGEYYASPEVMLQTQLRAREIFHERYGLPKGGIAPSYSAYVEASQLGTQVIFPEDNVPMVKGPVLHDARDVDRLKVLDPRRDGLMPRAIETWRTMRDNVPEDVHVALGGTEGPVTTAVIVRGQDFFVDVFEHPKEMHRLLDLVVEASLLIRRTVEEVTGRTITRTGIADDFSGLLSPEQYEAFAYPYQQRIYDAFGHEGRSMHSELLRPDHLKFLNRLGVTHYDPGCDQYLTVADLLTGIPNIPFSYNLRTSQDMLQGTPETIRARYTACVEAGAPEMFAEICRGTPSENTRAFIDVAREYE